VPGNDEGRAALGDAAVSMTVADETRDWPRPSDHVLVIADFEIE
jgi:hypothetical protein